MSRRTLSFFEGFGRNRGSTSNSPVLSRHWRQHGTKVKVAQDMSRRFLNHWRVRRQLSDVRRLQIIPSEKTSDFTWEVRTQKGTRTRLRSPAHIVPVESVVTLSRRSFEDPNFDPIRDVYVWGKVNFYTTDEPGLQDEDS